MGADLGSANHGKKLTENIFSRLAENITITDLLITQKTNPFLRL
jgi:hypothetical protein